METTLGECVICKKSLSNGEPTVVLRSKGSDGINRASEKRGSVDIRTQPGQTVHQECRREFVNPNCIERDIRGQNNPQNIPKTPSVVLRSESPMFDFQEHCLFCGKSANYSEGKKRGYDVYPVRAGDFDAAISQACRQREDDWSKEVEGRLAFVNDLHAADTVYHQSCNVNFRTGKQIPQKFSSDGDAKKAKLGRPEEETRCDAFLKVMLFMEENDDEQISISDLIEKMAEYLQGTNVEPYSDRYMKQKLKEHFGDDIVITELAGKQNVVTLRSTAESVLYKFYEQKKKESPEEESFRVVGTAAHLIRNAIKAVEVHSDYFPGQKELEDTNQALTFLPPLLLEFLKVLMTGRNNDLKLASIGQAIMQATRPRVLLAPLQFGLSTQMHHLFCSRVLVDTLHKHGFGCSYAQVQSFERSAAVSQAPGAAHESMKSEGVIQFVADNVDHDIATIDGRGTFHGMGMVATITPESSETKRIRRHIKVTAEDILQVGKVNIRYFTSQNTGKLSLTYMELSAMEVTDPTSYVDILWEMSFLTRPTKPAWSGMMQTVHRTSSHPGKSSVLFLPMIDMSASDMSCIYSTLHFVCWQARLYGVTPVVTFDQPLYWKATLIQESEPSNSCVKSVVLRLGAFHTQMSFLGSIGHLMAGSGLQELLETVYAANSVKHMLTGKAIARAIRGHLLVYSALNTVLVANAYNLPLPEAPDDGGETPEDSDINQTEADSQLGDLYEAGRLVDYLLDGDEVEEAACLDVVLRISAKIDKEKESLSNCRTAQLWFQYMHMVRILCNFIKAERTGNWSLHLSTIKEMLPYLAASGHNLYTKSAYVYLQKMSNLEKNHPTVYNQFQSGHHVIRRSDRYWSGLSTDLIIEQVLMRSIKSRGGLTRGRGMDETQRLIWLLGMPACAQVNLAMQTLTGVHYQTSEQHKEMGQSRRNRDMRDTHRLLSALKLWDPFASDTSLRGLANGLAATDSANVDKAQQVGQNILKSMVGKRIQDYSFSRKQQAVTLGMKAAAKINDEHVQVDPQLLFQRLSIIANNEDNPADTFKWELATYPLALFESPVLLREANKPSLADAMWDIVKDSQPEAIPASDVSFVIDGGALLQRLPWPQGKTLDEICKMYIEYISRRYGRDNVAVVFDGYVDGPSTKDATHIRRSGGCTGPTVHFTGDTILSIKKDAFLKNKENKHRFLQMLSGKLQTFGCTTDHARADADTLIVETAVNSAKVMNTVLVGEDTDLLVLLCHHADMDSQDVFFQPQPKSNSTKCRVWDIKRTKELLGSKVCEVILFIHAILGCDTTSRLHGLGKASALKMVTKDSNFHRLAQTFCSDKAQTQETIINAGEQALVRLYNGSATDSLDTLRYKRYYEKVMKSVKAVEAKTLPPTSAAAKFHSLRVYVQVKEWEGNSELDPKEWGWKETNSLLLPVTTDLPPAPPKLLEMIRCNCKTGCNTLRCSCFKNGLECTSACGHCEGLSCSNAGEKGEFDDEDED